MLPSVVFPAHCIMSGFISCFILSVLSLMVHLSLLLFSFLCQLLSFLCSIACFYLPFFHLLYNGSAVCILFWFQCFFSILPFFYCVLWLVLLPVHVLCERLLISFTRVLYFSKYLAPYLYLSFCASFPGNALSLFLTSFKIILSVSSFNTKVNRCCSHVRRKLWHPNSCSGNNRVTESDWWAVCSR